METLKNCMVVEQGKGQIIVLTDDADFIAVKCRLFSELEIGDEFKVTEEFLEKQRLNECMHGNGCKPKKHVIRGITRISFGLMINLFL